MWVIVAGEYVRAELGGDRGADVVQRSCHAGQLPLVEVAQDGLEAVLLDGLGLLESLHAFLGDADEDDPTVVGHADPLDETPLLHPIHDAGRIAERDVEQLRHPAHRQVAVMLEQPHDVHMGHADAGLDETGGTRTAECRDHVVDAGRDSRPWLIRYDSCCVNSSHDGNNLAAGNHLVNMDHPGPLNARST